MEINLEWLEVTHYYFFCMNILSFVSAIFFLGISPTSSFYLIMLCIFHSVLSWRVAWSAQKRIRKILVTQPRYWISHFFFTTLTTTLAATLFALNLNTTALIESILLVNFFLFFFASIWLILDKLKVVNYLFNLYDLWLLEKAKITVMRLRKIMNDREIKSYKCGSSQELDRILMRVWLERKTPHLSKIVNEFEIGWCENRIRELANKVKTTGDREMIRWYKNSIEEYKKRLKYVGRQ